MVDCTDCPTGPNGSKDRSSLKKRAGVKWE
jgi:hypothetical protein